MLAHEFEHAWLAQFSPILYSGFERNDRFDFNSTNEESWILKNVENKFANGRNEGIRLRNKLLTTIDKPGTGDYFIKNGGN